VVGDALFTKAKLIKDLGNLAVHSNRKYCLPIHWLQPASCFISAIGWPVPMDKEHVLIRSAFSLELLPKATSIPRKRWIN